MKTKRTLTRLNACSITLRLSFTNCFQRCSIFRNLYPGSAMELSYTISLGMCAQYAIIRGLQGPVFRLSHHRDQCIWWGRLLNVEHLHSLFMRSLLDHTIREGVWDNSQLREVEFRLLTLKLLVRSETNRHILFAVGEVLKGVKPCLVQLTLIPFLPYHLRLL